MAAPIYLDYNATTPVAPAVVEAMTPFWTQHFGNPSSNHAYGWLADEAVERAREQVTGLIGAEPRTLVFTSGATESCVLAMRGAGAAYHGKRNHVVVAATEHKAVLATAQAMERDGFDLTILPVDGDGLVDLDALREAVTDQTLLVSVMLANNETGVIGPIRDAAEIAHAQGAFLMTDATQALGKVSVDVDALGADLLALSGHKCYAPKGVGALFIRHRNPRVRLLSQITGGAQQDGLRGGTLNVPGIVGLGAAASLAQKDFDADQAHLATRRDRFEQGVLARVPETHVNGGGADRLPNTSNLRFDGVTTAKLLPAMRGLAVSTGSACQTKNAKPSHVLTAMGLSREQSFASVRFSLGRPTTEADIDTAIEEVITAVAAVREAHPVVA